MLKRGMRHKSGPVSTSVVRAAAVLLALLAVATTGTPARAQSVTAPNPRQVQAERPTVATHAFTVANGIVEVEAGVQAQSTEWDETAVSVPAVFKIGLGSRLQLDVAPGYAREVDGGLAQSGVTDLVLALKWHIADDVPVLGSFAVQPGVSFPTGSADRGTGAGHPGFSVLAISSHAFGDVAVDANLGYTRTGGDGTTTPVNQGLWCVSAGFPLAGRSSAVAEVFGTPGSSGPAGEAPTVGILTGPVFEVGPSLVLDAGVILSVTGLGDPAIYAGLTWNLGRAWGGTPRPQRSFGYRPRP
jgi:hypothetical protein